MDGKESFVRGGLDSQDGAKPVWTDGLGGPVRQGRTVGFFLYTYTDYSQKYLDYDCPLDCEFYAVQGWQLLFTLVVC